MRYKEFRLTEQIIEQAQASNLKALYHRQKRYLKLILAMLILLITSILVVKKFKSLKEEWAYMNKLTDYINKEMDRILQLETREEQNEKFRSLRPKLPLRPVRMTLSTAVFKYTSTTPNTILKRVIYNPSNGLNEDKMAEDLKAPNIVRTISTFRTMRTLPNGEQQILIWMFTELLDIKITQSAVRGNENIIRQIIRDSLQGLIYMHSRSIAHLDLKVGNVMGSKTPKGGVIYKLIDFGYSQKMPKSGFVIIKDKNYGTFPYKPPEIMFQHKHGLKSDIWSIGAIAWYLSLQYTAFYLRNNRKDLEAYRRFTQDRSLSPNNHRFIFNRSTSDSLKSFVKTCMQIDPVRRPTAVELLDHPFITGKPVLDYINSSDELDNWSSESSSAGAT